MTDSNSTSKVAIVTDSTSDIPPELLKGLPITVVPLKVELDGQVYRDMIDLTREDFLERLKTGAMPKTSQPSVGEFQEVFRDLVESGHNVISIVISPKLSGTFNSAATAARNVSTERITVIDSGSVSMGLGALVLEAASLASQGMSVADLTTYVRRRADDIWIVAALETLENLRRGGRIGLTAAFLGSALQIKPIVQVKDGEIIPLERVRTFKRALDRMLALAADQAPFDRMSVMHLGARDGAMRLAQRLQETQPEVDVILGEMGTVVGTYGGPGIMGIAGLVHRSETPA